MRLVEARGKGLSLGELIVSRILRQIVACDERKETVTRSRYRSFQCPLPGFQGVPGDELAKGFRYLEMAAVRAMDVKIAVIGSCLLCPLLTNRAADHRVLCHFNPSLFVHDS